MKQLDGNFNMFEEKPPKEKVEMYQKGMSLKSSVDKLRELLKDYSNENPLIIKSKDGEEARLGRSSIGKLVSNAAAQKSMDNGFTREQQELMEIKRLGGILEEAQDKSSTHFPTPS